MFLNIVNEIIDYYYKSELGVRELALGISNDIISLTPDFPYYNNGIRNLIRLGFKNTYELEIDFENNNIHLLVLLNKLDISWYFDNLEIYLKNYAISLNKDNNYKLFLKVNNLLNLQEEIKILSYLKILLNTNKLETLCLIGNPNDKDTLLYYLINFNNIFGRIELETYNLDVLNDEDMFFLNRLFF